MAYVEIPCKDPEEVIMFDPLTCKYFRAAAIQFAPIAAVMATNKFTLQRQALALAAYAVSTSALKKYRKKIEEEERRERKRIKNRKKRERMKEIDPTGSIFFFHLIQTL